MVDIKQFGDLCVDLVDQSLGIYDSCIFDNKIHSLETGC